MFVCQWNLQTKSSTNSQIKFKFKYLSNMFVCQWNLQTKSSTNSQTKIKFKYLIIICLFVSGIFKLSQEQTHKFKYLINMIN